MLPLATTTLSVCATNYSKTSRAKAGQTVRYDQRRPTADRNMTRDGGGRAAERDVRSALA